MSWSHFILISAIDGQIQRKFYAEMCRVQRWSVRGLKKHIDAMLYECTALSKESEGVIEAQLSRLKEMDEMTPALTFKEPYFIDFIG